MYINRCTKGLGARAI